MILRHIYYSIVSIHHISITEICVWRIMNWLKKNDTPMVWKSKAKDPKDLKSKDWISGKLSKRWQWSVIDQCQISEWSQNLIPKGFKQQHSYAFNEKKKTSIDILCARLEPNSDWRRSAFSVPYFITSPLYMWKW